MKLPSKAILCAILGLSGLAPVLSVSASETLRQWAPDYRSSALTWVTKYPSPTEGTRPLFVHIGAFGQELSRAMAKQSFLSPAVCDPLQAVFVPVLLDRDEDAEWAGFAQGYLGTTKQLNGWPANLWLTPELKPFEGAAYLPPSQEWGGEGIRNVIDRAAGLWEQSPDEIKYQADEAVHQLTQAAPAAESLDASALETKLNEAAQAWLSSFDAINGGFGEAPRYPEPELLRFLLNHGAEVRQAALFTLEKLGKNGLRTPEGGVFRRSTEATWESPIRIVLAGDQARLALAYLDAFRVTQEPHHLDEAARLLRFVVEVLQRPDGAIRHGYDDTQPDGAPRFTDERAFSDENGLVLVALRALLAARPDPGLSEAAQKLTQHLSKQFKAGLTRREGSDRAAGFYDSVWVSAGLALSGDASAKALWNQLASDFFVPSLGRLRAVPSTKASLPWPVPPVPPANGEGPNAEALVPIAGFAAGLPIEASLKTLALSTLALDVAPQPRGDLLLAAQLLLASTRNR